MWLEANLAQEMYISICFLPHLINYFLDHHVIDEKKFCRAIKAVSALSVKYKNHEGLFSLFDKSILKYRYLK